MKTADVLRAWSNENNYCAPRNDYYFNLNPSMEAITTQAKKQGQKFLMQLGRKLPSNLNHAKFWIKNGCVFDLIGTHDIRPFAAYCEMIGFQPTFKFTKSQTFVRLENVYDFHTAIKQYFNI